MTRVNVLEIRFYSCKMVLFLVFTMAESLLIVLKIYELLLNEELITLHVNEYYTYLQQLHVGISLSTNP